MVINMAKYVRENAWRLKPEEAPFAVPRRKADETLLNLAKEDKRICFVISEGMVTEPYVAAGIHPYRTIGLGIAEENTILVASGLAKEGFIPVYSYMGWMLGVAYNVIFQSVATDNLNVKLVMYARGWAGGGASHHEINDIAFMRCIPQMLIMAPADPVELVKMLTAGMKYNGATFIRIYGQAVPNLYEEDYPFEIGKASIVREGDDISIISFGTELWRSLTAADILAKEGIEARVINMSTLKPLDEEAIVKAAKETGAIVTAEDHNILGGLGEAVARVVCKNDPVPVDAVGIRDRFSQSTVDKPGGWALIEEAYNLTAKDIAASVRKTLKKK
jgi:transketolase